MPTSPSAEQLEIRDLSQLLPATPGFAEVVAALRGGLSATIDGAWGSASALTAASLSQSAPQTLVVVAAHVSDVERLQDDLETFTGLRPEALPAWDRLPGEGAAAEGLGGRLRLLKMLQDGRPPRLIVTAMEALLQPVPSPDGLARSSRPLRAGALLPLEDLARWLVERGLSRMEVVELPGEFSVRGGILDVFPLDAADPVRIEFFGDVIESIRRFHPETQRSLEELPAVSLTAAPAEAARAEDAAHFAAYLPPDAWFVLVEPADLRDQGTAYLDRVDDPRGLYSVDAAWTQIHRFPSVYLTAMPADTMETACHLRVESIERFSGDLTTIQAQLDAAALDDQVLIACHTEAERQRLGAILGDGQVARAGRLHLVAGRIHAGFHLVDARVIVLSDDELFRRQDLRRPMRRRPYETRAIDSFLDLHEGDSVVHLSHGIGIYRGMHLLDRQGTVEEHLCLEFQEGTRVYVPASKIDLVQKYIGGAARPVLSKIGTTGWERRKQRVEAALVDLASEMLDLQAQRQSRPGFAFPPDTGWQTEFEAAFPYSETEDQLTAMEEIRDDLCNPRPMDRLICGDVGYGKTELAMRAAFKVVDAGKQVAVLVPTTVLAEQHYRTFTQRMAEYPLTIEVLSRLRSRGEQKRVLDRVATGGVDIVIGTHRLVQPDVRFHDLGLVIVDEEQRFGVEHKEWLKELRATVDVLTLSATPIPRTLHMALLGIRDISNLETPPQDRLAIETRIARFDPELIRHAIVRELNRDGQVFFVHNRVQSIRAVAERIQAIVPEARIVIGHGQMAADDLEQAMLAFVNREADILVATTIIESGLDIPNANTIFINDADRYGLADLHQLRGRVGRYKNRAYAYLLLDPQRPIVPNAARRLKAIEEFRELGAGFQIAMRDLEIRGAGNILGAEQSGHIASIGYELYCHLLENAVRCLNRLPVREPLEVTIDLPWQAFLPRGYIPSQRLKIELYRRLSRLRSVESLDDLRREIADRFGPLPEPAEQLIALTALRILAQQWQVERVGLQDGFAVFHYRDRGRIEALAARHPGQLRIADATTAWMPLGPDATDPARVRQRVRALLDGKRPGRGRG